MYLNHNSQSLFSNFLRQPQQPITIQQLSATATTANHYSATFCDSHNSQSLFSNFLRQQRDSAEIYQSFWHKTHLMVWSTDTDDAKMLLDIPLPMNYVMIHQLALNLLNICLDHTLQLLYKSLLCFAKVGKIDWSKFTQSSTQSETPIEILLLWF